MSDLKKCPYCKSEDIEFIKDENFSGTTSWYYVECKSCDMCSPTIKNDYIKAINVWNRIEVSNE